MEKFLIVDGNSLVNRAFYALPLLQNQEGEYSNAVYGFVNILLKFITEQQPTHIAVAFDHSRHTFRTDMFKEYKGTRKAMPDELRVQMPILKDLLKDMNIKTYEVDGIEADDIIGTLAKHSNLNNIILSGDRDVLQLVDKNTQVWLTKKGITEVLKVDDKNMQELYGFTPSQVVDMKSLMGDSADNIPGVSGVGEKTALNLIQTYKTLDNVYNNIEEIKGKLKEKLTLNKDMAYLSYKLATIKTDCNIEINIDDFKYDFPFNNRVKQTFTRYNFKTLLKRNDIFMDEVDLVKKQDVNIVELKNVDMLPNLLKDVKYLAFNFNSTLEFCVNDETLYVLPAQMNLLSCVSFYDVLNLIKPLLSDESLPKITCNLKAHYYLSELFREIKGEVFDIEIAKYLIHAGENWDIPPVNEYYSEYKNLKTQLKELDLDFVYNHIELPLCKVLYKMETNGFKIDVKELDLLSENYKIEQENISNKIYELAGHEFNIKSPKQIATVLFDELNLSDKGNKKHSTSIDILNSLESEHEIVSYIIRFRKLQKLTSTYLDVYKKIVAESGDVIHTVFNQTLTSTGRLSSSEPNLQNIPVRDEEGEHLRKLFISSFNNGLIISADYNQIELRLLAHLSNDENLLNSFNSGNDIHSATASKIFNKDITEISSKERSVAKATNFGIVYGISPFGLSQQIHSSVYDAKIFMEKYKETYPNVTTYMDGNIQFAKQNGYVKTMYGRIRKINEISSPNKLTQSFGERVAMNMPLQGSASDIIKLAMIKVQNELEKQNLQSKLILQIHDELIIDTKFEEKEQIINILKTSMENVVKLNVPLLVKIESGKTWYDVK